MFEAKAYRLAVYGGNLTGDDQSFIDRYCKVLTNYQNVSKLESMKYTRELPDGGHVIIQCAGGILQVIAQKPEIMNTEKYDGIAKLEIPMLFCGVIDNGMIYDNQGVDMRLSETCSRRLTQYESAVNHNVQLKRFRCPYTDELKPMFVPSALLNTTSDKLFYSQYDKLKATWYSGAMAEAVQIVSGFGRQDFDVLPVETLEQVRMSVPIAVYEAMKIEVGEQTRLPAYTGFPDERGCIQYNFIFTKTNLIAFDVQKNPWLIQVGSSGVWAIPLPIIPATTTQAFRDYIQEKDDLEILKILDRFGGIPSGETFPIGADFYRWVRAGVIIKVCDTSDFYTHSAYSTACGWSSNLDGTSLINTCFDYIDNFCYGYTYQIKLNLGVAEKNGWLVSQRLAEMQPKNPNRVARYLSELFEALDDDSEHLTRAIKYKLRRIPIGEIESRSINNGASDVEYWDNYNCTPIASHTGHTVCSNGGYLFSGVRFKIPEPFLEGCVNMDFTALTEQSAYPRSDTIVFAYFIEDTLKVIKSFHDERGAFREVDGDFEDIMIVGTWEQTVYNGVTGLQGEYYSTDFDDRKELAPQTINTKIKGSDKGYGTTTAIYHFYGATDGVLSRDRFYTHHKIETTKNHEFVTVAFIVPYFQRNATIYVKREGDSGQKIEESLRMYSVKDPYRYLFWTYDFSWHYISNGLERSGKPFPVDGYPIWAEKHEYSPTAQSDFADEGPWLNGLPSEVSELVNEPGYRTLLRKDGIPPTVDEFTEITENPVKVSFDLKLSLLPISTRVHQRPHADDYYSYSPDKWGNMVFEDACKVVFGKASYANISIKNEQGRRYNFGHSALVNHTVNHTFIGVINE